MSHLVRRLTIGTVSLCVRCLLPWTRQSQAQQALFDIGTVGGDTANPEAINAYGQVVGGSEIAGNIEQHAFLWTPATPNGTTGTWTDLGHLGGAHSYAYGINDAGAVVGRTNMPGGSDQAFHWTPETANGTTGTMEPLGTLGGWASEARGVNDTGQIVGWSHWSTSPDHANEQHASVVGGPDGGSGTLAAPTASRRPSAPTGRSSGGRHARTEVRTPFSGRLIRRMAPVVRCRTSERWTAAGAAMRATSTPSGRSSATRIFMSKRKFAPSSGPLAPPTAIPPIHRCAISACPPRRSYDASYATGITHDGWVTGDAGPVRIPRVHLGSHRAECDDRRIIDGLTLGGTYAAATGIKTRNRSRDGHS